MLRGVAEAAPHRPRRHPPRRDIEFADDYEYVFNETYAVLQQLKKEGKTRFIGMSCYPLGLLKQAIERCDLDAVISYALQPVQHPPTHRTDAGS